jgi:hypothetical protein
MKHSVDISFSISKILNSRPINKFIKKIEPAGFIPLLPSFAPKTEPAMIPPMSKVINIPNGMTHLFLRYQGRLADAMKNFIKNTDAKKMRLDLLNFREKSCT